MGWLRLILLAVTLASALSGCGGCNPFPREPLIRRPILPLRGCRCDRCRCKTGEPITGKSGCKCAVGGLDCGCLIGAECKCRSAAAKGGLVSPDGKEEIACDLPKQFHLKNVGGTDGAGLCVFASIQHSSTWQRIEAVDGVFKYMQSQTGGGWPARVDQVIATMAKRTGLPSPGYIQVESRDPLAILKLACKTARMPGVTYGYSPTGNYGGQAINHMVSLVHASENWFAILDNNYPGQIEWMDPATFLKVHTTSANAFGRPVRGNGWSYVFLGDAPPPVPCNR